VNDDVELERGSESSAARQKLFVLTEAEFLDSKRAHQF